MTDSHDTGPDVPPDSQDGALDRGLDHAFAAPRDRDAGSEVPSVLGRVLRISGSVPAVSLPEAGEPGATPMLRPLGEHAARISGKYVIQGELGRGGVGAVHRGHDQELGRDVAMKFLHEQYRENPEILHRFVEEAQIGGQLQHPGIVPVYDLGMSDGRPFFTMKLVKGQTLARLLSERKSPADDRRRFLSIFEQVCQTVAYAHARGVVHRDLKPANVMLGAFGEVQVVDWGMGKVLQKGGVDDERRARQERELISVVETLRTRDDGSRSLVGSVIGTPAYMPPEQAFGQVDAVDERADVFALGAMLCEILTGRPPYPGDQSEALLRAARADTADAVAALEASGAGEALIELCKHCIQAERGNRPRNAEEVARRVTEHLSAVEDRARQAEIRAAESRVKARSAVLLSAAAVVFVLLGVGAWQWSESIAANRRSQSEGLLQTAMQEAAAAQALADGGTDMTRWEAAHAAWTRVATLVRVPDLGDDVRDRAERTRAAAETAYEEAVRRDAVQRRDQRLRDRLLDALAPAADPSDSVEWAIAAAATTADAYRVALEDDLAEELAGRALEDVDARELTRWLAGREIALEVAFAMDHWILVRRAIGRSGPLDELLLATATSLDSTDPFRRRLRGHLLDPAKDRDELLALADQATDRATEQADDQPPMVMVVLAEALHRAGRPDAAKRCFTRLRTRSPELLIPNLRLGMQCQLDGDFPTALECLRSAIAIEPELASVRQLYASALGHAGQTDESVPMMERLLEAHPESPALMTLLAVQYLIDSREEECLPLLERSYELDPNAYNTCQHLASSYIAERRTEEALEVIRPLAARLPRDPSLKVLQASAHLDLEDWDAVLEEAGAVIELAPENYRGHYLRGRALARLGDAEASRTALLRAKELALQTLEGVRTQPRTDHYYRNLTWICQWLGETDEACRWLERLAEVRDNGSSYAELAELRLGVRQYEAAIAAYREALARDLRDDVREVCERDLIHTLLTAGHFDEAEERIAQLVATHGEDSFSIAFRADALRLRGETEAGITMLESALQESPDDAWLLEQLTVHVLEAGRYESGAELADRLLPLVADNPSARGLVGMAYARVGRHAEALPILQASLLEAPHHGRVPSVRNSLALSLEGLGREEEALAAFEEGVRLHPYDAALHGNLCKSLMLAGRLDEAVRAGERAVELDPRMAPAWLRLAMAHWGREEPEQAAACFEKSFALQPDLGSGYNAWILALMRLDRRDEARTVSDHAIEHCPDDPNVFGNRCILLEEVGRNAEAVTAGERAVALNPDLTPAWFALGNAYRKLGRTADCIRAMREVVRRNPEDGGAWMWIGYLMLMETGEQEEGLAAIHRCIDLGPPFPQPYILAARTHLNRNEPAEALAVVEAVPPQFAREGVFLDLRCHAASRAGQHEMAIAAGRAAVRALPSESAAHGNLGFAFLRADRLDEAVPEFEEAIRLDAAMLPAYVGLAKTQLQRGEFAACAELCRKAQATFPPHPEFDRLLGEALLASGEKVEGLAALRRYLEATAGAEEAFIDRPRIERLVRENEGDHR